VNERDNERERVCVCAHEPAKARER